MKKWSKPKVDKLNVCTTKGGTDPTVKPDDISYYNWGYTVEYGGS